MGPNAQVRGGPGRWFVSGHRAKVENAALIIGMTDQTSTELPELWGVDELAAYLGTTKHYVYRLTCEHRIRFVRVGKTVRFRRADIAAWMEAETVEAAGPEPTPVRRGRPRNRDRGEK